MTVTAVGNEEDENVDVEGDSEVTTMYVYGGGGGVGGWPQHNRMRHQPMLLHGGGYGRSEFFPSRLRETSRPSDL